ncbi:MAG TPA: lactonase family protein [Hyphomicrobiaceae bacterium]|nr:lactonase family protein [Hyphomicrobiaceae bacterium]
MFAYVGSFTTEKRKARGNGLNVYRVDEATGAWSHVQHVGGLTNPSYLALSPDLRFLYSVHGDEDYATAFALDPQTGKARLLDRAATGGRNGVRQAIDPAGRFMVAANYASGTVAVMAIAPDGSLKDQHQLVPLTGERGPHRIQQTGPLPHDVVFDPSGRFVVVPDKGLDRVFAFSFDAGSGRLEPTRQGSVQTRPGAGPRHLAFHPRLPVLWVLNELDSTTTTYRWDAEGTMTPVQVITTLPTDFVGYSTTAEIAVSRDGRFVYASNRGHDSVAIFAADADSGLLAPVGWQPTQGSHPRFICLDPPGRFLYAANEQGDTIVQFRADAASGALTPTGHVVRVASPVTIVFAV